MSRHGSAAICIQTWELRAPQPGRPHRRLRGLTPVIWRAERLVKTFQSPVCYSKICMLTFLLARNICICHRLLNEPHLSTTDHSYPSIIKTNILKISYVSASLHLQFYLVSIFYSTPSLFFFGIDSPIKWVKIHFPHILNGKLQNIM